MEVQGPKLNTERMNLAMQVFLETGIFIGNIQNYGHNPELARVGLIAIAAAFYITAKKIVLDHCISKDSGD